MSAAEQSFEAMGLRTQSPWDWRVTPAPLTPKQRQQQSKRNYKAKLKREATRVNPESSLGYLTQKTNSEKAPR